MTDLTMLLLYIVPVLQLDGTAIITGLIESSPTMAVAGLFGWYMHKQGLKKDAALKEAEIKHTKLVERFFADTEKRILSEQQQLNLIEKIIERTDALPSVVQQGIALLERNQKEIREDQKALREDLKYIQNKK